MQSLAVQAEPPERQCGHGRQLFPNPVVRDGLSKFDEMVRLMPAPSVNDHGSAIGVLGSSAKHEPGNKSIEHSRPFPDGKQVLRRLDFEWRVGRWTGPNQSGANRARATGGPVTTGKGTDASMRGWVRRRSAICASKPSSQTAPGCSTAVSGDTTLTSAPR